MGIYLIGVLWVAGAVLIAAILMIVVRRYVPEEHRHASDESAGRVFTVVAGLNAVIIGFVLISLFDAVGTARTNASQEANNLVSVYWDADLLPAPARQDIQHGVISYANTVINQEWPSMQSGKPVGNAGKAELDRIHDAVASFAPPTFAEEDRQTQTMSDLSAVYQARQQRSGAEMAHVSNILWWALVFGAALSVLLTCFFGGGKLWTQVAVSCVLAGILTVLLYSAYQLQNPYGGAAHVASTAFASALGEVGTAP